MVRAAVLAIVVSLGGAPAVTVLCSLACATPASTAAAGGHQHNHAPAQSGNAVSAVHTCDVDVAVDPFLPQAAKDWSSQVGPLSQMSPETGRPALSLVAEVGAAPTDVGDMRHSRSAVLRI